MVEVVGAPLQEGVQSEWTPALSGMGPEKTVSVFNPLSADFRVLYSRSMAAQPSTNPNAAFARDKAGLDLSKRGQAQDHRTHAIILPAGQTINLPGDIAQKAVQDLITYILGVRTGHKKTADPFARQEVESEIIQSIKNTTDLLNIPIPQEITPVVDPPKKTAAVPDPPPGQGANYVPAKN